ncbi:MAG TPA: phage holin family protein [Rhodocyclaceae bacterium]|jgi:uncharacterized membrane protein YqjE|nr:phage holin family protein [Rhodocyclaceae bacterium]HRQ47980.1 phage holin family protein [Rhodocyclaceae bacterium]
MDPKSPSADDATQLGAPVPAPGLIENLEALWADLRGTAHDHLQLAALEAQRALLSLVWIAVFGTVAGMLVAATWLAAVGAMVLWLIESGLAASAALLLGAVLNLLGAFGFALLIRRKSQLLRFPATVRALDPDGTRAEPEPTQAAQRP